MTRNLARLLLGAILVVAAPAAVPTPASADSYPSLCPAMTDSITRLYYAYFQREPDPDGFNYWVQHYKSGDMSLEEISDSFANSPEFVDRDLISSATYTTWLYRNLLERAPTGDELDHWTRALDGGYPRGSVTLTLTESYDYVVRTGTVKPLSGYLRWYPDGTHWYCDIGAATVQVRPLLGDVWADYYFKNRGDEADEISLWTLEDDRSLAVRMNSATLSAGFTDYNWDGVFVGDGDYGSFIDVETGATSDWIVVFYPRSIGEDRLGWQLSS